MKLGTSGIACGILYLVSGMLPAQDYCIPVFSESRGFCDLTFAGIQQEESPYISHLNGYGFFCRTRHM